MRGRSVSEYVAGEEGDVDAIKMLRGKTGK
jgi:hypothetical protein